MLVTPRRTEFSDRHVLIEFSVELVSVASANHNVIGLFLCYRLTATTEKESKYILLSISQSLLYEKSIRYHVGMKSIRLGLPSSRLGGCGGHANRVTFPFQHHFSPL
jgi:hypothetical protein